MLQWAGVVTGFVKETWINNIVNMLTRSDWLSPMRLKTIWIQAIKKGVLIRWNTREGQCVVRLLVLVSSFGETNRETIIRCYTQPQIQFYWSNDKSPISDKLFFVILLYNVWKVLCVLPRDYPTLCEWIWMYRELHLWAPEREWLWVR